MQLLAHVEFVSGANVKVCASPRIMAMHNSFKQAAAPAPVSSCVEILSPPVIHQVGDAGSWEHTCAGKHDLCYERCAFTVTFSVFSCLNTPPVQVYQWNVFDPDLAFQY